MRHWEQLGGKGEIQLGGSGQDMETANGTKQHNKLGNREPEIPFLEFLLSLRDSAG